MASKSPSPAVVRDVLSVLRAATVPLSSEALAQAVYGRRPSGGPTGAVGVVLSVLPMLRDTGTEIRSGTHYRLSSRVLPPAATDRERTVFGLLRTAGATGVYREDLLAASGLPSAVLSKTLSGLRNRGVRVEACQAHVIPTSAPAAAQPATMVPIRRRHGADADRAVRMADAGASMSEVGAAVGVSRCAAAGLVWRTRRQQEKAA